MDIKTYLYYISTESPAINVARVKQRVKLGGHQVKEEKIISRYYESLSNLLDAVQQTYRTFVFDNSGKEKQLILEVFKGEDVIFHHKEVPKWIDKYIFGM